LTFSVHLRDSERSPQIAGLVYQTRESWRSWNNLLTEGNQGEPFAYLLYDAYALQPSDAGPNWQASERSVDLAERAERAEVVLSCVKE